MVQLWAKLEIEGDSCFIFITIYYFRFGPSRQISRCLQKGSKKVFVILHAATSTVLHEFQFICGATIE